MKNIMAKRIVIYMAGCLFTSVGLIKIYFPHQIKIQKLHSITIFKKFLKQKKRGFNMPDCKQCCGTCRYGSYDKTDGYICVNSDSEYVADFVEYKHVCDEWESK